MHDKEYEKLMLISIIKDFVKFADYLKDAGRISDELYKDITEKKIRFLEEYDITREDLVENQH